MAVAARESTIPAGKGPVYSIHPNLPGLIQVKSVGFIMCAVGAFKFSNPVGHDPVR